MKVVLPRCKNLLLNSSFTILFLSILFQFPLSANNIAFSSTVDNSSEIKASQLDHDRNIITSQNTGNSNSNTNDESQNRIQQEQTSDISLEDDQTNEEVSEIPEGNQEGVNQVSEGQQQPTIEIHPACGQIVQGKVKLISNLICKSDGLIVGANHTIIDMNGFSLKGPGLNSNKVGIMIGGQNNVTISGNGIISGFQSGRVEIVLTSFWISALLVPLL